MMTDKPTSKNSDNLAKPEESRNDKANTMTKSTQKSVNISSQSTPQAKVSVNMSDSTKAIMGNSVNSNKASGDQPTGSKNTNALKTESSKKEPKKSVENNTVQKQANETVKPSSSSQLDKKPMKSESSSKVSKVALLSLLIALLAVAGVVVLYFWHMQQQAALTTQLNQIKSVTAEKNILAQNKMVKTLKVQEKSLAMQFANSVNNMKSDTQNNIEQLNEMVEKFSQNQPTDWLVHEAEYLVRVAARTLWLEKDTTAAIGLLQDADARIAELNDPEILPVRQLIYQDIEVLKLIPKLETEEAILSLMALGEQIQSLPLITMSVPQENANVDRFKLSEDISDWRNNVSKTLDRFLETFVVVHSRVGQLEPILPIVQRENLKENLNLKLQIAQWAASKGNHDVFVKSLTDAQSWLIQYFEMNDTKSIIFKESLENIKSKIVLVNTEHKLSSLKAIRQVLASKKTSRAPRVKKDMTVMPETRSAIEHNVEVIKREGLIVDKAKENLQLKSNDIEEKIKENVAPIVEQSRKQSIEKNIENSPTKEIKHKAAEISEAA